METETETEEKTQPVTSDKSVQEELTDEYWSLYSIDNNDAQ